jgi:P-type Mg2+ transporter
VTRYPWQAPRAFGYFFRRQNVIGETCVYRRAWHVLPAWRGLRCSCHFFPCCRLRSYNFMYDVSQLTIPTDRVDKMFLRFPAQWVIGLIRKFMFLIGPISSIFDFLGFWVLLRIFRAGEMLFHTRWFVESLATQALVIFVIRTMRNPVHSRPSCPLAITSIGIVAAGIPLLFTPVGALLGFVPLSAGYFAYLSAATIVYLVLVEVGKRTLLARLAKPAV